MRTLITCLLIVFVGYMASLPAHAETADDYPLAYKLASIDAGYHVPEDHITVARFRSLLEQLSGKYIETDQQIANMTVKAQRLMRDEGVEEKLLNIMEGMNRLFVSEQPNMSYAEYASAYVVLRNKGQTHDETIKGLHDLLAALGIH
jgi:hypothetical protein